MCDDGVQFDVLGELLCHSKKRFYLMDVAWDAKISDWAQVGLFGPC